MDYELRIPNGVGEQVMAHAFEKFEIDLRQSEYGPVFVGKKEELLKVQEYIYEEMNKRLKELEK